MKFFNFIEVCFFFLLFCIFSSCEKDIIVPLASEVNESEEISYLQISIDGYTTTVEGIDQDDKDIILGYFSRSRKSSDNLYSIVDSLLESSVVYVQDRSSDKRMISIHIESTFADRLFNAVFLLENNSVEEAQILEYHLSQDLIDQLENNELSMDRFIGDVSVWPIEKITSLIQKNSNNECFTINVINQILYNSSGGSTGGGGPNGPGPGNTSGPVGGSNTGSNNGNGSSNGSGNIPEGSICFAVAPAGSSDGAGGTFEVPTLARVDCETGKIIGQAIVSEPESSSKSQKVNCSEIIEVLGIHTGYIANLGMTREQQWESLMNRTPFKHSDAAKAIIDLNEMRSCRSSPTACAKEQLIDFGTKTLRDHFGRNTLISSVPRNIRNNDLLIISEALLAAMLNDNDAIYSSIEFTLRKLSNPYVRNNLASVLVELAVLYENNSSSVFNRNAENWLTFNNRITSDVSQRTKEWLLYKSSVLSRLASNDIDDIIVADLSEIYVSNYLDNPDFKALVDGEFDAASEILWVALREVGVEVAVELAIRYVPGFNQVDNLKDLVRNASQGDVLGFLAEVLDIVKGLARNVPGLQAISLAVDGIELTAKASKTWRAIAKMERTGSRFANNILETVSKRGGKIIDSFKYKDKRVGATLNNLDSPEGFFDDFQRLFPNVREIPSSQLRSTSSYTELAGFRSGQLRVIIKYGGTTFPDGYTLEAKNGGAPIFKIRLNYPD